MKKPNNETPSHGVPEQFVALVGKKIQFHRTSNGLSRPALAEKSGINVYQITKIETGKSNGTTSIITCLKLARALNVRLPDIINESESEFSG
jgi:transcriptional regulator with XRE-family HTH domain